MPDISKITLPSGTTYDIKDATARSQIAALAGGDAVVFVGVSTTALTDGGNETPTVGGETKIPATGQLFFYGTQEFIYGADSKWHALGSLDVLGDLAYKNSASGNYTPSGTVSQPTFTGTSSDVTITSTNNSSGNYQPAGSISAPTISVATAGTTDTIHNPTKVTVAKTVIAAAPGATAPTNSLTYYSVSNETLSLYQLGYTTGDSITTSDVTVKTSDATYSASQPTFTGTKVQLSGTTTANGTVSQPTFTGTQATVTVE